MSRIVVVNKELLEQVASELGLGADVVEKTASVLRGSKQMTTVCPKCGKIGAVSAMKRWHFNACRVPG